MFAKGRVRVSDVKWGMMGPCAVGSRVLLRQDKYPGQGQRRTGRWADGGGCAYSDEGFGPVMVALDGLHLMAAGKPAIPVHLKSDVLWYGALAESAQEELSKLLQRPFDRGRADDPFSNLGRAAHSVVAGDCPRQEERCKGATKAFVGVR
jgi:hypothetical protein